jgi:hypothetical protein
MAIAMLAAIWFCALLMRAGNAPLYLDRGPTSLAGRTVPAYFWVAVQGAMPVILAACLALPLIASRLARKLPETKRRRVVLLAITIAAAIGLPTALLAWDEFRTAAWGDILLRLAEIGIHSIPLVALSGLLALVTWLCAVGWGQTTGYKPRLARGALLVLVVIAGLPGAWIYWHMVRYAAFPKLERRPVNHYHRIVAIARRVHEFAYWHDPLPAAIQTELDEAVTLLRESNYAPVYSPDPEFWGAEPGDWLRGDEVRSVTARFAKAAEAAAGDHDRAADYALAIIRLDAMVDHGGSSGHANGGYQFLVDHRANITAAKARDIIQLLEKTLDERYPAETVAAWSQAHFEKSQGWRPKLHYILAGRVSFDGSADLSGVLDSRKPAETTNRLLQADLAIRAFASDHGRLPVWLEELTPEYLPDLPIDPYSGKLLVYRLTINEFVLYSVGLNGIDDGGKFTPALDYDLSLQPFPRN